jgi:hypothetical protein
LRIQRGHGHRDTIGHIHLSASFSCFVFVKRISYVGSRERRVTSSLSPAHPRIVFTHRIPRLLSNRLPRDVRSPESSSFSNGVEDSP